MSRIPILNLNSLNGLNGLKINSPIRGDRASEISFLGDINRDGYADVSVGLSFKPESYILFGASQYPRKQFILPELKDEIGFQSNLRFLRTLGGPAGDLNGDGIEDFYSVSKAST